jgi:3-oxoacyl-[acyl-carrier-protein] synthase II
MTIYVTGLGAVTALGRTARATWDAIVRGERAIRPISLFNPGEVKTKLVAEVTGLEVPDGASRTSELALLAAREAIADAGIDVHATRTGLVVGGTTAGMFETESLLATLLATPAGSPERSAALSKMLSHPLSAPTDRLVKELGPFTHARSISSACSSGANALVLGALWLEMGMVDAVVCGAADSLCRVIVAGFNSLGALDPEGARPFEAKRRGLTLGEGAGFVVLTRSPERAKCTLLGWAVRSEAHHITNPEASGAAPAEAIRAALGRAGVLADEVNFVDAHGTGTPLNDPMETRALKSVFGNRDIPISSQKGMIGHTLAAAGAIEAVITAYAITEQTLPPTGGLGEVDAECTLRHVQSAESARIDIALSNSFGFGGMDTALVFGRPDHTAAQKTRRNVVVTGLATLTAAGLRVGAEVVSGRGAVVIPEGALDPARARRLDRTSQMGAVLAQAAGAKEALVFGNAFGAVDGTAEFMRRLQEKGPRLVRPADFPSLVPSSPAGYVSIYSGLRGPAFVLADLAVSGEAALMQAWELVAGGEVGRACAVAVEEKSAIVEGALGAIFGGGGDERGEGGAAISLAVDEGQPHLAKLAGIWSWMDAAPLLPPPPPGAIMVADEAPPAPWRDVERVATGVTHEAAGAIRIALAVGAVARGAPAALFYGSSRGTHYAGLVTP